jgi:demethylmenaquinone methyltransferase/2-methoxy-6-polyprenyl-1,4-benzoquinol methylase
VRPTNLHFDFLAGCYDRLIPPPESDRLPELLDLPTPGWLLEVGGGTGRIAALLAPQVGRLVISDLSVPMLAQAQLKGIACQVQAYAERLPFPDGHFDRVVVVDALHHFANQRRAVAELVRVLRAPEPASDMPGGRLVIEEPDIGRLPVKLVALAERLALMGSHFHRPAEIGAMAAEEGCRVRVVDDGRFNAWVVAEKRAVNGER